MSTTEKAIVSAVVDENTRVELRRLAARSDRTLSGEIRHALRVHVERSTRRAGADNKGAS